MPSGNSTGPPPHTRKWTKRLAKWVLGGVVAFLLVFVTLIGLLQLPSIRIELKDRLAGYLSTFLNATVSIGAVTGDFLNGMALENLRVTTVDGDMLSLECLSVGYSIPLIFNNTLFIRKVHVRGLQVSYVSHADGSSNFSDLMAPVAGESNPEPSRASDFQLVIGNLILEDSGFVMKQHNDSGKLWKGIKIDTLAARFAYGKEIRMDIIESAIGVNEPLFEHVSVSGTALFDPEALRLSLNEMEIHSADSSLQLTAVLLFNGEAPSFDAQLICRTVSLPELKTGFSIDAHVEGELRGLITAKGDFSRFSHHIELVYHETTLKMDGVVAVGASGGVDLTISGAARRINPEKTPFGSFVSKRCDINADFTITAQFLSDMTAKEGSLVIDFLPSQSPWAKLLKGNITADISDKVLKIRDIELMSERGTLQLEGALSGFLVSEAEKHLNLKMQLRALNLETLLPGKKVPGKANLDIILDADLPPDMDVRKSRATLTTQAASSQIGGINLTSGILLANWRSERIEIESFEIDTDHGKLSVEGEMAPFQRTGRLMAHADLPDLSRVYKTIEAYFPEIPRDLALTGEIRLDALVTGALDAAEISVACKGQQIGVMAVAATSIEVSGKRNGSLLKTEGVTTVAVDLRQENANRLALKGKIDSQTDGTQKITINTLAVDTPRIAMSDALENKGPIRLQWHKGGVVIDALRLQSGEATLSLTGAVSSEGRQHLALALSDMEISRLSWLWETGQTFSGRVSASIGVQGTAASPLIKANLIAEKLSGYQLTGADLSVDLSYADSKGNLSVILSKNGSKRLEARGTIDSRLQFKPFVSELSKSRLDLSVQTSGLRLSDLPILKSGDMVFDAAARVDMRISGEAASPDINGNLTLTDGYLTLLKNGLTYETMTANILFSGETIEIQDLFLKGDKEGYLRGAGTVHLKGITPDNFDLSLSGEDFFIPYRKAMTARVKPRLKLTGSPASPVLSGEIFISESRINLDRMAGQAAPEIQLIESPADSADTRRVILEEKPSDFMNALMANVTIQAPKNAWLKGQDLNTEITGEIGLIKEPGKSFWLLGELNTRRGTYYFRGRQFTIETGTVEFIGLEDPNPNINVKAVTKIQTVEIIINISGTARKLVLTLDSDPHMDQSDIISYLVFGKPTDSLKGGQALNAEKAAMRFSGGLLASELRGILGEVFFLDAFGVESGENGGGAVSVGKYIRPNLFMTYRYGLAEDEPNQLEISYELNPNIRVETQLGNDKNSGVDLFWQLDF